MIDESRVSGPEVKTLEQQWASTEMTNSADKQLAEHLAKGWQVLNISIVVPVNQHGFVIGTIRIVTLRRG